MKGVFWLLAFFGSLVLLAVAYYVTSSSVRTVINARVPWVEGYLRPYVRNSGESESAPPKAPPAEHDSAAAATTIAPAAPVPVEPEVFDIKKLATNKAAWPAKVAIKKATNFPAVVNGKVVGGLIAPAGTEVGLVKISDGKLGVEYQGGGAWMQVEETDLVARWERR